MATLQTLEAFEAYAAELFPLVGAEVLEQALQRLLKGNGHKALISLESLDGPAAVRWCLDGLRQPQPWQPVARVTVLEALSVDEIRLPLDEAPALLAFAPEAVAKRFGQVLVSLLSEEEAGSWLKSLGQCAIESRKFQTASEGISLDGTEALRAYARGTAAVLRQFPREAYCSDAWSIARQAMLGDAGDRQICVQQLLPDLVAVSAREVAAVEISNMVELLGTGQTAAAVREALNLATSFSELLLDFWKLPSLQGDHNTVGVRLISDALRLGQKDCGSLRKQARFLLESAVQKSLVAADAEQCFQSTAGQSLASTSSAWRVYWELFDTLEDYSSHLIKSSWQALSSRLAQYLATLLKGSELPPAVLSPFWFEVFLLRALDHDNDTVQKFVLGQLMCLDEAACLSESFILTEVLPRFGHGIDSLYLRTDVERTFERQAVRFFSNFLRGGKAARLLEALFAVKAVHFTPVRLVLEALASSESGDLEPAQALDLAQRFFSSEMLLRMPNSVRQMLASLFLRVLVRLCVTSRDCPESGSLVAKVATTLAVIPDALLAPLQSLLGSLVQSWLQLDADASAACAGMFLKGLLSAEDQTKPMEACQQTLGLVRLLWALQGEALFLRLVCPVLAEAVRDMHRRSYLPRRVAVCALLLAAYGAQMLKQDSDIMDSNCLEEILSYVENQAMLAMGQGRPEAVVQEAPWVWLYALVLERWHPRRASQVLPKALEKLRREEPREPAETLGLVAAASLLGAVAHMAEEKSAAFLALLRFQAPGKPSGVVDSRFGIGVKEDLGQWQRSRLEEYEDLQRIQHEGLGRVQEWRDASSVVLVAKWRALAQIVRCKDFEAQDLGPEVVAEVLEELDSLQAPHVAYWAVVARRLYPLYFAEADGEKQDMLERLCRSIRGFISQSVGDGAVYMARGCLLELAAALCDLRQAEVRLKSSSVTQAVRELLALGELGTGVSRAVVTPLLSTLLAEATAPDCEDGARQSAADLLTSLLVHSEYTIKDGALCHSAKLCAGALDPSGPAGAAALHGAVDGAEKLCEKFGGTPALPRILALAALDGLAQRSPGVMPGILREILTRLLAMLRKELQSILDRPGGANKPLTPMPLSPVHRLQLRGWQAVLILGCHADDDTVAELLPELFWHLRTPHLPDVRDYQELLGCVLSRRFQDLAVKHLVDCLAVYDCNNQVSASLLVIASFLFLHWSTEGSPLAGQLLKAVAPYLGHNSAYVRGTAAWGFFELMEAGASKDPMLVELHRFLVSNRECQKMRRRLRPVFQAYDTSKSALEALTDLAEVLPRTSDAAMLQPLNIFADGDFKPSQSFLTLVKDEVAQEMDEIFEEEDFTQYASSSEHWQEAQMAALRVQLAPGEEPEPARVDAAGGVSGLQRKFVPPAPPRLQGAVGPAAQRAPLVVIASLVDKIPNLAGLCRTCEVFHCEALCLPNLKVTSEQAFQSISVTAEKWLPLRGVPRKDLRAQLLELRHRGYTLLGVEQTHTSVPLDQWEFTEHTAILLGAEKEGIDAELLPLLDGCVEIPQQGQLRSLNVHVSGSIVVWEYVRQARRRH